MRKRTKIFLSITFAFTLCFTLFSIFAFNTNVYADTTKDVSDFPNQNADFSEYLNLVKEAEYDNEFDIMTFNDTSYYMDCSKIRDLASTGSTLLVTRNEKPRNIESVGFKVNGEFYTTSYRVDASGTYNISVCKKVVDGNITKAGTEIEHFKIHVNLESKISLLYNNFYVENYNSANSFKDDIISSIIRTDDFDISIVNQNSLEDKYYSVVSSKEPITTNVQFRKNNKIFETEINITTLNNVEKNGYSVTRTDFFKNIYKDLGETPKLAIASRNIGYLDSTFKQYLISRINRAESQYVSFSIKYDTNGINFGSITTTTIIPFTATVTLTSPSISNETKKYEQTFTFYAYNIYNQTKANVTKIRLDFLNDLKEKYSFSQSKTKVTNDISLIYLNTYFEEYGSLKDFSFMFEAKKDLENKNNPALNDGGHWISKGEKTVRITLKIENNSNDVEKFDFSNITERKINIVRTNDIKILTRYDVILMKDLNDTESVKDQIKVVSKDDIEVKLNYTFDTEAQVVIITVVGEDIDVSKTVFYTIEQTYDNGWLKFLYNYKKFLKNIF